MSSHYTPSNVPESLCEAFANGTLLPIVGAGVSLAVTDKEGVQIFPSWGDLLRKGADRLDNEQKPELAQAIRSMLLIGRFKTAAELLREGLTGSLWTKFFRDVFAVEPDLLSDSSLELARTIWKLSPRVVTLNYDKVLRFACPSHAVSEIDNLSKIELSEFESDYAPTNYTVWHLHGRLDNINELILTTESYDKLYIEKNSVYSAALNILSTVIRKRNLLFIGCSLNDVELLETIAEQHDLFNEATGPHYALVRAGDVSTIKERLKSLPIHIVPFEEFGYPLIDLIKLITSSNPSISSTPKSDSIISAPTTATILQMQRVAVLTAQPLNRKFEYDDLLKEIGRLKCEVVYHPLSLPILNDLNDFDYIIILSKLVKGEVVIEDENLVADKLSFKGIEDSLGFDTFGALIYLLDYEQEDQLSQEDLDSLTQPTVVLPSQTKAQVGTLAFKLFNRCKLDLLSNSTIRNSEKVKLRKLSGTYRPFRPKTSLPDNIDPHAARNYIGRATDLENICRKIFQAKQKNEVVTIKGSGGIGKTLTMKKLAIELANRCFFSDGINFVDCEAITSYEIFQYTVAQTFDLEEAPDLRKELSESDKRNCLLILDNLENLLHVEDKEKILSLINFLSDYATLVVTSRETLNISSEEPYDLRRFTTDEAYDLFMTGMAGREPSDKEKRFIRNEILETLLDNNPLAIKLVTQNTPKNKNWTILKQELEADFFNKVSDSELEAFDSYTDINIERKKSLYASINYSFQHLTKEEKVAFELLSLFPDGINSEHFKQVVKISNERNDARGTSTRRDFVITDPVLKGLEKKSMIQVDNHIIKLQSIVRKFSEQQFRRRPAEEISRYFNRAFYYNQQFVDSILDLRDENQQRAITIFNGHQNNFLASVTLTNLNSIDEKTFITYLSSLGNLFSNICALRTFQDAIRRLGSPFEDGTPAELTFSLISISNRYYEGKFDEAFLELQERISLTDLSTADLDSEIIRLGAGHASVIYGMEGFAIESAEFDVRGKYAYRRYPYSLFSIGEIDEQLLNMTSKNFFTLEMKHALGKLTLSEVDSYISSIHEKSHLELMQSHYTKSKISIVPANVIKKLVVINPYTAGLKELMLAFIEQEFSKKTARFERALEKLTHIKYYYVEALYFYASFLKSSGIAQDFDRIFELGHSLAVQHHYRYLRFLFENMEGDSDRKFNSDLYPLPRDTKFKDYISFLIQKKRSHQKFMRN